MADMIDCGESVHDSWAKGSEHQVRWLGPYDANLDVDEVVSRLDMNKLTAEAVNRFKRGFLRARELHLAKGTP